MERVIGAVYIDAIVSRLLKVLGLPANTPFMRLGPMLQHLILVEARALQEEAHTHGSLAWLVKCGASVTREAYLELEYLPDAVPELDAERESLLPELFREDAIEERVRELLQRIDNPGDIQLRF